ncbi:MAG: hypothetical protein ACXVHW_11605 [Methanobacterium sp.]
MKTKILVTCILFIAGLILYVESYHYLNSTYSPCLTLRTRIEKDIIGSLDEKKNSIHHIQLYFRSNDAYNLLQMYPLDFPTNQAGKIWLEIEIIDLFDIENPGFITQTSIFELKSKNKILEFGHTYHYMNYFRKDSKMAKMFCDSNNFSKNNKNLIFNFE